MIAACFQHCRRSGLAWVFVTMALSSLAALALAADDAQDKDALRFNLAIKDSTMAEVMTMLSEAAGVDIVLGQDVTGSVPSITLTQVTAEEALRKIALSAGLYWYKDGNGYLVTKHPLPPEALGGKAPEPAPAPQPALMGSVTPPRLEAPLPRPAGAMAVSPLAPRLPSVPAPSSPTGTPAAVPGGAPAAAGERLVSPLTPFPAVVPTPPPTSASPAIPAPGIRALITPPVTVTPPPAVPAVPPVARVPATAAVPGQSPLSGQPRALETPARPVLELPSANHQQWRPPLEAVAPVAPLIPVAVSSRTAPAPPPTATAPTPPPPAPEPKAPASGEPVKSTQAPPLPDEETRITAAIGPEAGEGTYRKDAAESTGGGELIKSTVSVSGADNKAVFTYIPVKYADPARLALLFGGTVEEGPDPTATRRAMRDRRARPGQERTAGGVDDVAGASAMDRFWSQIGLGGGLGRGIGGLGAGGAVPGGGGAGAAGQGSMRPPGVDTVIAFMPQNALLVSGEPAAIDQLRELLSLLDQPAKQVEISTKFLEVELTEEHAFGIDWLISNGALEFFQLGFAPGEAVNNLVRWSRGKFEATLGITSGRNRGTVVNEPHVVAQNNMPASIDFTTTLYYTTATITYDSFGNRVVDYTVEPTDVTQSLFVTPRINADDTVTMFLSPTMDGQVGTYIGPYGENNPIISSQNVSTQVTVPDGETVVLGGIIRKQKQFNTKATPLLSEIPIIGKLFRSRRRSDQDSEMLIFVTPRIVRQVPTT